MKKTLKIVLVLVVFALVSISSYITSIYNTAKAIPSILVSGSMQSTKDCFGIVDFTVGDLFLVEDGICGKNLGGRYFMYKIYDEDNPSGRNVFYLENYQVGKVYTIYAKEGSCLWWHNKIYRIGCQIAANRCR